MAAINPQAINAPMLGMIIALRKRPNACTFVFIFFILFCLPTLSYELIFRTIKLSIV